MEPFVIPPGLKNDNLPFKTNGSRVQREITKRVWKPEEPKEPEFEDMPPAPSFKSGQYNTYCNTESGPEADIEQFKADIDSTPMDLPDVSDGDPASMQARIDKTKEINAARQADLASYTSWRQQCQAISDSNDNLREQYQNAMAQWVITRKEETEEVCSDTRINSIPSVFSFRNTGVGKLYICPAFLDGNVFGSSYDADIGNTVAYGYSDKQGSNKNAISFMSDILENIPAVQIREYQVDYMLDQIINLLQKFQEGFQTAVNASTSSGSSTESVGAKLKSALDKVREKFPDVWEKLKDPVGLAKEIIASLAEAPISHGMKAADLNDMLLTATYLFYYRLMSYTTTNYYVVPYTGHSVLMSSDGSKGWDSNNLFQLPGTEGGDSILGGFLKSFLGHVKIHKSPKWKPGNDLFGQWSFDITFQLFNYDLDSAMNNYVFVNTIIPNNMWVQYGLLQHAPSLYDIKIEGGQRMFCCTGNFKCSYKGALRAVPRAFIDSLSMYFNTFNDAKAAIDEKIIKIPDVYELTLSFSSLLPNNYNNFLWQFAQPNIHNNGGFARQDTIWTKLLENAGNAVAKLF